VELDFYPWSESFDNLIAAARKAEDRGFRAVWSSELHRTAFVPLAAMAGVTNRVRLASGIAWAFTRSPMITALTALDLDELTGGRFTLGLGSGVKRLNTDWHNVEFDGPVGRLRDTVAIIRAVIAGSHVGQPIVIEGSRQQIHLRGYERPIPPARESIPIYLASVGPQMTRLAGEIADGWIGHELGSPSYLSEHIMPNLAKGLADAGRDRSSLDVVASGCCVIHEDGHEALRRTAGLVAFYASVRTYTPFFAHHGFKAEALQIQKRFREGDIAGMIAATPDEMVDAVTLSGTLERVKEKLAAFVGLADAIKLSAPTHYVPLEVTRDAQESILDHLDPAAV
jgi:probable F420-dependent oxidoreductase